MNIAEANAVNIVLRYMLNERDLLGALPTSEQARDAAMMLADRAHKPLMAGLTGDRVRGVWVDDSIIWQAARALLHGEDADDIDLGDLADALGVPREDVAALPDWHDAYVEDMNDQDDMVVLDGEPWSKWAHIDGTACTEPGVTSTYGVCEHDRRVRLRGQ